MRVQRWRAPRKNEVSGFFERLVAQNAHEFGLVGRGGRRPGPLRSVTVRAPEFDDRSSLQQNTSPRGTSPCGLFLFSGSPGFTAATNARSYSYSMKWYSYSKGAPETPAIHVGRSRPVDRYVAIVAVRSLRCDRYSGSLRWFICGGLSWRARQKNNSINAGKIGTNDVLGCCFNLSRHKAIERVVDDLKLSRLGSYNHTERSVRLPLPRFDASL